MKFLFIFFFFLVAGLTQTLASTLSGRIYKGFEALHGMFPYQVLIRIKGSPYIEVCSGALIGKSWILTAAHCVEDYKTADISAYLGSVYFGDNETVRTVQSDNVYIHKGYNNGSLANDIAVLKVAEVVYSDQIQPVKLPKIGTSKKIFLNHPALTSGWGTKGDNKPISETLHYTLVHVVSQKICKEVYFGLDGFHKSEICVDTAKVGSPCMGDSGGPLLDIPTQMLIGILSSTYVGDCESGKPVIYTSITDHRLWIRAITGI